MADEFEFIDLLRGIATHEAARGLADDAAVLAVGGTRLVLTSDTLVEGVHFRADDPPETIGWKLAAVNLSDLAAKGARPVGCLMNYALSDQTAWDRAFVEGLTSVLTEHRCPLIGGDTVRMPADAPRGFTLTAIGEATSANVPSRGGARPGDTLWVTGTIGDAGAGLALLEGGKAAPAALIDAYRRPRPRLADGIALAPHATAMMDISDGLLIDARRMVEASGVGIAIDLDHLPLSPDFRAERGEDRDARLFAATAGDDYQLLFAWPAGGTPPVSGAAVGRFVIEPGLKLTAGDTPLSPPQRLGWSH